MWYNAFMQTPIHFFAMTDLVVVGTDPEMADYDNPRGEIIRSAAYVVAEDAQGYRVRLHIRTGFEADVLPKAEREAAGLNARLNNLKKLPVGFGRWEETRPGYGSDAFIESDQGHQDWLEERMAEEAF